MCYNEQMMNCESCHKNEAETAIPTVVDGMEDERIDLSWSTE